MFEPRRCYTAWVIAMLLVLHATRAGAQVALEQLTPQPLSTDGFAVGSTTLLRRGAWAASATLDYANDPLVYRLERGPGLRQRVVSDQLALQLGAAVGVHPRLTLFMNLPVQLMMRGDSELAIANLAPEGAGIGDLAVGARIAILAPERGAFSLAGELIARLPTAELTRPSQRYSGDRVGSYEAAALGELRMGVVDLRLRLGIRVREPVHLLNLDLGQSLTFATGLQVRLPRNVSLHAELFGTTYLTHAFRQHHTPMELLLGPKFHYARGWIGVAAGPGLVDGYGSPDVRVLGMLGFAAKPRATRAQARAALHDRDDDGVIDSVDGCPDQREDRDLFQDADGCLDADNDGDGIDDPQDACPREAEDRDGTEDGDGCPEPDAEGVPEARDRCAAGPGSASIQGCPPLSEPEPVAEPSVEFGEVLFAHRRDHAAPSSMPTLHAVLSILHNHPQLKRVRVEGHADDSDDPTFNDELSARRTRHVAQWLTHHGIAPERLELVACGRRYPRLDEPSESARVGNRRVEFFELDPPQHPLRECKPVSRNEK
jgi:outer membrane protein OmpA-like peptidoglycan-associated protein